MSDVLNELFDWIIIHKSSVLDGMSKREQKDFTELFGKARAAMSSMEKNHE